MKVDQTDWTKCTIYSSSTPTNARTKQNTSKQYQEDTYSISSFRLKHIILKFRDGNVFTIRRPFPLDRLTLSKFLSEQCKLCLLKHSSVHVCLLSNIWFKTSIRPDLSYKNSSPDERENNFNEVLVSKRKTTDNLNWKCEKETTNENWKLK